MQRLLETVRSFDGVLELAPLPGSAFPEVSWGDHFFYYAPDGTVPARRQPYATIVTKNYPGDTSSGLDHPGRWRLNIHIGASAFVEIVGEHPLDTGTHTDHSRADTVLPHPLYRSQGWIAIVDPGPRTLPIAEDLLRRAHDDARRRSDS
ncbi:hypothetical protein Rrhod_3304 [Rhodococcus rhodnii LMG 5362]|uniref:DUF6194 domain-containing protein n=2 Tax=Rhodococcus rhodnii TaxID=38312 RepID=R7WJL7_9NOCA|nr:hypothetical protein Rrhod_3304 [Rhodococcus rhodnii LMG 5362]